MFSLLMQGLIGLAAGSIAKMITPQEERGGWVSSIGIGIAGSIAGGFIAFFLGMNKFMNSTYLGELIVATGGAVLVLFIYHKYFAEKWNLPI